MKPGQGHPSYRPDIDGLRALAILSVIGFHAFPAWIPGGFTGVDIFFVISGFLITGLLLRDLQTGCFSLATFYARRVRRIFPALIVVLAAVLAAGYFILWLDEYKQLGKHAAGGAAFIVNILLGHEAGYFDTQAATKPLLHLWSLGIEEQFYIFWPLLLWAGWKIKRHTGLLIASIFTLSFAANIYLSRTDNVTDFYSILPRFWELLAGGSLAWALQSKRIAVPAPFISGILSCVGLALIFISDFALDKTMAFPGWLALLPVAGTCFLIAAGPQTFLNRRLLANPAMVWVGLISYPLYLWHWPLLSFAHILCAETPQRSIRVAMVALAFALAAATYYIVEKPLRQKPLNKKSVFLLATAMGMIGMAGLIIYGDNGMPQRFADQGVAEEKLDSDILIKKWERDVRMGMCHLRDDKQTTHDADCIEARHPLLLLWGDSHAAMLYPGLKALQNTYNFGIAQLTQASCPPLFGIPNPKLSPHCGALNQDVLNQAVLMQPQVILLQGAWTHKDYNLNNGQILTALLDTVARIRRAVPAATIIVGGPGPLWLSPLPAIYRRDLTFGETPPQYSLDHLDPAVLVLEKQIGPTLTAQNIPYLSLQAQLCNAQGCLTRSAEDIGSIAFVDESHITAEVSQNLIAALAPVLLKPLGLTP